MRCGFFRGGSYRSVSIGLSVLMVLGLATVAMGDTVEEVTATVKENIEYTNKNLKDLPGTVSKEGSLQFWSSGGLMQWVGPDAPLSEFEYQSLTPKHIQVIPLVEGQAAVAMYYMEGRFKAKGGVAVDRYLTRVTEVFVKEDGRWKVRAAHWSAIEGGTGTNQNSLD